MQTDLIKIMKIESNPFFRLVFVKLTDVATVTLGRTEKHGTGLHEQCYYAAVCMTTSLKRGNFSKT